VSADSLGAVLIENDFRVPAPIEDAWAYLLDVEKIARCAPGAELTETVDDRTWKGRIGVKLGPVSMSFAGTVSMRERDDAARRLVLEAKGRETKGKGAASAIVTAWLEEQETETLVRISSDVTLTGTVAQLSRGLLPDVSRRLTNEFAECLRASMTTEEPVEDTAADVAAAPRPSSGGPPPAPGIGGIRLGLWALWRAVVRAVGRLFGRR
jgi:carbon monoxide dehydrogenase subunit G